MMSDIAVSVSSAPLVMPMIGVIGGVDMVQEKEYISSPENKDSMCQDGVLMGKGAKNKPQGSSVELENCKNKNGVNSDESKPKPVVAKVNKPQYAAAASGAISSEPIEQEVKPVQSEWNKRTETAEEDAKQKNFQNNNKKNKGVTDNLSQEPVSQSAKDSQDSWPALLQSKNIPKPHHNGTPEPQIPRSEESNNHKNIWSKVHASLVYPPHPSKRSAFEDDTRRVDQYSKSSNNSQKSSNDSHKKSHKKRDPNESTSKYSESNNSYKVHKKNTDKEYDKSGKFSPAAVRNKGNPKAHTNQSQVNAYSSNYQGKYRASAGKQGRRPQAQNGQYPYAYYMVPFDPLRRYMCGPELGRCMHFPPCQVYPGSYDKMYIRDYKLYSQQCVLPLLNLEYTEFFRIKEWTRRQVEYYFSPRNLFKDMYFRANMDRTDGTVPLSLISRFNRVLSLTSMAISKTLMILSYARMQKQATPNRKNFGKNSEKRMEQQEQDPQNISITNLSTAYGIPDIRQIGSPEWIQSFLVSSISPSTTIEIIKKDKIEDEIFVRLKTRWQIWIIPENKNTEETENKENPENKTVDDNENPTEKSLEEQP